MAKNYSSLNSNTTLGFNKKTTKQISSGNDFKIMNASWFFMVLMLLSMTTGQKAVASNMPNHTPSRVFNTQTTFINSILISSIAEGRGGGGGHGKASINN